MEIEPTLFWILLNKSIGIIYVGKAVIIFQKNLNTFFKRQLFYRMVRDEDKKGDAKHLQLKKNTCSVNCWNFSAQSRGERWG